MNNQLSFNNIESPKNEKVTRSKLIRQLEELNVDYCAEEAENGFTFFINLPEKHIVEQQKQMSELGSLRATEFESRYILPIIKRIKSSRNLECELDKTDNQILKIIVFKK